MTNSKRQFKTSFVFAKESPDFKSICELIAYNIKKGVIKL